MSRRDEIHRWCAQVADELFEYDGFVVTYPPAFALLYDLFDKPIILDIPIRYEQHFTERPNAWRAYNDALGCMTDDGRLKVVANNRYDAIYYKYFTGRYAHCISSTCNYIDRVAPKWSPRGTTKLLAFGDYAGCRAAHEAVPDVLFVRDVLGHQYRHDEIIRARGIVWIPYTTSIMSFFEHYWLEIPLFVPSEKFLLQLYDQGLALSGATCHKSMVGGSNLSRVGTPMPDPHTREGLEAWMPLYDFYDTGEFPHVTYFDSWTDLRVKLTNMRQEDLQETSAKMSVQNALRKSRNLESWRRVLTDL